MSLNSIEQDNIISVVNRQEERIARLEALLNGQGIRTAKIADASITDAKIVSLSANKITAGDLIVAVDILVLICEKLIKYLYSTSSKDIRDSKLKTIHTIKNCT